MGLERLTTVLVVFLIHNSWCTPQYSPKDLLEKYRNVEELISIFQSHIPQHESLNEIQSARHLRRPTKTRDLSDERISPMREERRRRATEEGACSSLGKLGHKQVTEVGQYCN
jgi:hypothetical protein